MFEACLMLREGRKEKDGRREGKERSVEGAGREFERCLRGVWRGVWRGV